MKIGIDIRCLMNGNFSGVSWYAYYLLDNLFQLDHDNEYILFYNSSKPVKLPKFDYPNVSCHGYHYPNKLFNLSLNFFNRPKLDKLLGVDMFFTPNLHFTALTDDCRQVIAVHDLSFMRYPNFFTHKMRLWHRLILSKKILQHADIVCADSQNTKNDLLELLKLEEKKIKVVNLGVANEYFEILSEPQLTQVREKYRLPEKFILALGTLEPRKNLASVIGAYKMLEDGADLVIAGGSGWKDKSLRLSAKDNEKLRFIGYVGEADKPAIYQLASALAYPSYYEGFGLPILEAMASGCPVICGNNSSQVEVAGDAALLVNPYSLNEITLAMEAVLNDQLLRGRLIGKGRDRARQFSWENTALQMLNIINNI